VLLAVKARRHTRWKLGRALAEIDKGPGGFVPGPDQYGHLAGR